MPWSRFQPIHISLILCQTQDSSHRHSSYCDSVVAASICHGPRVNTRQAGFIVFIASCENSIRRMYLLASEAYPPKPGQSPFPSVMIVPRDCMGSGGTHSSLTRLAVLKTSQSNLRLMTSIDRPDTPSMITQHFIVANTIAGYRPLISPFPRNIQALH